MKRNAMKYILLPAMLLAAYSCEHKELCFDHDEHAPKTEILVKATYQQEWEVPAQGGTDWESYPSFAQRFGFEYDSLRPAVPEGLRVQVYNDDGTNNVVNLEPEGGTMQMRPGEHSLLFYNNDTEYIVFDDMNSYASARATTRAVTRSTYLGSQYMDNAADNTVNQPDMLYGNYMESYTAVRQSETVELPVTMHPLVFTYVVRYEFSHGLEYVALARGALAGMAESVMLNTGRTSAEAATILFDCTLQPYGAQACVRSFGVPDYPNALYKTRAATRTYALNLEVRLNNGQMKTFDFDVTDQVAAQPEGGVIVVKDIEITDEEGQAGGSGFDVTVDGWGEFEDIELTLHLSRTKPHGQRANTLARRIMSDPFLNHLRHISEIRWASFQPPEPLEKMRT